MLINENTLVKQKLIRIKSDEVNKSIDEDEEDDLKKFNKPASQKYP